MLLRHGRFPKKFHAERDKWLMQIVILNSVRVCTHLYSVFPVEGKLFFLTSNGHGVKVAELVHVEKKQKHINRPNVN